MNEKHLPARQDEPGARKLSIQLRLGWHGSPNKSSCSESISLDYELVGEWALDPATSPSSPVVICWVTSHSSEVRPGGGAVRLDQGPNWAEKAAPDVTRRL